MRQSIIVGINIIKLTIFISYIVTITSNVTADKLHQLPDYYVFGFNNHSELFQDSVSNDDIDRYGVTQLREISRYLINVDIPFDFGSSDGLVPYLGMGSNSVNIRGIEGNRIGIYIDGIPQAQSFIANSWDQSASSPGGTGRNYFDPNLYEGIDISRNSTSEANCPLGFTGSINFNRPSANSVLNQDKQVYRNKISILTGNKSLSNQQLFAKREGKLSYLAKVSLNKGKENSNRGKIPPNPTDFYSGSALFSSELSLDESKLKFDLEYFKAKADVEVDSAENTFYSNERVFIEDKKDRHLVSLQYHLDGIANTRATSNTRIYYQKSKSNSFSIQQGRFSPTTPDRYRDRENTNTHDLNTLGLNFSRNSDYYKKNYKLSTSWGLNLKKEAIKNSFLRTDYVPYNNSTDLLGFCPSSLSQNGAFIDLSLEWGIRKQWRGNIYSDIYAYNVKPSPNDAYESRLELISAEYGIEKPIIKNYQDRNISTSLSLSKELKNNITISGKYSKAYRNPTPEELSLIFTHGVQFVLIPNPDLVAEESDQYEVSISKLGKSSFLNANLFYNKYNEFIDPSYVLRPGDVITDRYNPIGAVHQVTNRGSVTTHGFELSANFKLEELSSKLNEVYFGSSFGRTIGINKTLNQWLDTVDPFKYVLWIEHNSLGTRPTTNRISLSGNTRKSLISGGDFPETKGYLLLDYSGSIRLNKGTKLNYGINNLLNRKFYKWSSVRRAVGHGDVLTDRLTEPGRSFFVSLITNF